jgi:hypothetical protein
MANREERIRNKAYELWEQAGKPEGREADHWAEAERQVDAEDGSAVGGINPGGTGPAQPDEVETVEAEVPIRRKNRASAKPQKMPSE